MPRVPVAPLVCGALLSALVASPHAQAPRRIEGRVVADDTGDPIPNVKVALGTPASTRSTLTGPDGRFSVDAPPGLPRLSIAKAGYARRDIAVPSGPAADIRLARTAVITGQVLQASGEPAANVAVRAEAVAPGGRVSTLAATTTDDRGEYRLSGLAAGRAAVVAEALGMSITRIGNGGGTFTSLVTSNATLYYPRGASASEAEPLELRAGDEIAGIHFVLPASYVAPTVAGGLMIASLPVPAMSPADPGERTTTVRGRVMSATGGGVPGAKVSLIPQARMESASVQSGSDGRFVIDGVVPGSYVIGAARSGYSSEGPPVGRALTVESIGADVEISLTPWSDVSGRVVDELGDPVQGAAVQLLRLQFQDGRRRLVPALGFMRTTDDRGLYRLFGVPPGQYVVSASASDVSTAELPGYTRTYYPGVADLASAVFITIGAGESRTGTDVALVRQRTFRVSGTVRDAQGGLGLGGSLNLRPSQSASALAAPVGARIGDGGVFEFPNVPPGLYVIQAYRAAGGRNAEGEFGTLPVTVNDRDVEGLIVQATAGSAIGGRVSFLPSGAGGEPPRDGIEIEAVPTDPDLAPMSGRATASVHDDDTFVLKGISGPRRLEVTRLPPGWMVREIRARGVDVTDRPLAFGTDAQSIDDVEIELTDRLTQIAGRVRDRDGRPAAGTTVVVFAPDRDRWYAQSRYMRAAPVARDGSFAVEGLPSGSYYVAAVAKVPAGGSDAWRDPAFLQSLVVPATSVAVGDGGRAEVAVTVVEPR